LPAGCIHGKRHQCRRARPETERRDAASATERPKEYFSVRLTLSGAAQEFEDPRQAGEAFFRADPAERPSVAHIDGNTARTMARTEIHGVHETARRGTSKACRTRMRRMRSSAPGF
jgi:hypothetical protein